MEIICSLEQLHKFSEPCVIALGTFDGLHLGHRDVIAAAKEFAVRRQEKLAVFTFSNHPLSLIKPELTPLSLITGEQKYAYLEKMGVDILLDIPFDKKLADMPPSVFLEKLQALNYNCLVIGENFSFGYLGEGNSKTLAKSAAEMGFKLIVRPLVSDGATIISSTEIRRQIAEGNIVSANKMLGRIYSLSGVVVKGNQRGNLLGFPTANLELSTAKSAVPKGGVYAVKVYIDGREYNGMSNIGKNPTFGDVESARLETNVFDYSGDLYGRQITVAFYKFIRGEQKFASVDELCKQLNHDRQECRDFFAKTLA